MNFGLLCCGCQEGSIIPRWQNVTAVQLAAWHAAPGDCSVDVTTGAPQYRFNGTWYNGTDASPACTSGSAPCGGQPPGSCGPWYAGPDGLGAFSTQDITDMVNDIMACGGSTVTIDHNCFSSSGTVDRRTSQRFGHKSLLAAKAWHGVSGFKDRLDPHCLVSVSCTTGLTDSGGGVFSYTYTDDTGMTYPLPPQVRYRTVNVEASSREILGGPLPGGTVTDCSYSFTGTVGRYTGIQSFTGSQSPTPTGSFTSLWGNGAETGGGAFAWNSDYTTMIQWFTAQFVTPPGAGSGEVTVNAIAGGWQMFWNNTIHGGTQNSKVSELFVSSGGASIYNYHQDPSGAAVLTSHYTLAINNTSFTFTFSQDDTTTAHDQVLSGTSTVTLSDPYTSADVLQDWKTLQQSWALTDPGLYPFRTDEELANMPLVCYDEMPGPVAPPAPNYPLTTMDDYTTAVVGGDGWNQIPWQDPNNYFWTFNGSNRGMPSGWTGGAGAMLNTGIRTGQIISHTQPGSDPFFWFNFLDYIRVPNGSGGFQWVQDSFGAFTPSPLPACAVRWQNKAQSQYDPDSALSPPPAGNWPPAWLHQEAGLLIGAKYIQAAQPWPAVNYARPCGTDKYSVDQETVCCFNADGIASGIFFVAGITVTGNAIAPLATGGLQPGDYIAVDGFGIYKIDHIDSVSGPSWIIYCTTSTPIEALPGGFVMSSDGTAYSDGTHVGRLRFYTIAAATCTGALNTTASQRTGVYLEWHFNPRAALWAAPPTWYGGISGCLNITVNQFNYGSSLCRAVVGIVPFYESSPTGGSTPTGGSSPPSSGPAETWSNQTLFPMPDTFQFDDVNGAHWQAAIMLTMPDPFWQQPFKPDCDGSSFTWDEDNGCGTADALDGTIKYYPHHPLVEASSVPAHTLPSGIYLAYDPAHNIIPPPYYPNGIPIGSDSGDYGNIETDWGFAGRACANIDGSGRWSAFYSTFVNCTSVVRGIC